MMETLWWSCHECGCLFPSIMYAPLCPSCKESQDGDYAHKVSVAALETLISLGVIFGALCWVLW